MTFTLDLRFDLKRLDDERLAAAFAHALKRREALPRLFWHPLSTLPIRWPFRHRAAYRAWVYIGVTLTSDVALTSVLLGMLGMRRFRRWILDSVSAEAYLLECELLDLIDEMKWRVATRGRT